MNLESFCCVYLSFMKISLAMTSNKYCTLPVQQLFPASVHSVYKCK